MLYLSTHIITSIFYLYEITRKIGLVLHQRWCSFYGSVFKHFTWVIFHKRLRRINKAFAQVNLLRQRVVFPYKKDANLVPPISPLSFFNSSLKSPSSCTILCKPPLYIFSRRYMFRTRQIAAQSTFHFMEHLCSDAVINHITATNHSALIYGLMGYCLDPNQGTVQHNWRICHSYVRNDYPLEDYLTPFRKYSPDTKVVAIPNTRSDLRVLGELPVLQAYERKFSSNISTIRLTGDNPSGTFYKQKQPNPDVIVAVNIPSGQKEFYQDIKSGTGMTKHSSRGSIGLITFDPEQKIIPVTNRDMSLFDMNKGRLNSLKLTVDQDNIPKQSFKNALTKSYNILFSENDSEKANDGIQDILWRDFQCHPEYKRSVAFMFTQHQTATQSCPKFDAYKRRFLSMLGDRTYDLDKIGDRKAIAGAMVSSYDGIDPKMKEKVLYLIHTGKVSIDTIMLQELSSFIKDKVSVG